MPQRSVSEVRPESNLDSKTFARDPLPADRDARGEALEAYRAYLLLVANKEIGRVLRPKEGASDLVQLTLIEAHKDLDQFTGQSRKELKNWLRQILRHNLSNFYRRYQGSIKRQVGREVSLDGGPEGYPTRDALASSLPSPARQAILSEQSARLNEAMSKIKERDRLVLIWHNHDDCSWKEIGQRIGVSEDNARKIWVRAVKRLRKLVGES